MPYPSTFIIGCFTAVMCCSILFQQIFRHGIENNIGHEERFHVLSQKSIARRAVEIAL